MLVPADNGVVAASHTEPGLWSHKCVLAAVVKDAAGGRLPFAQICHFLWIKSCDFLHLFWTPLTNSLGGDAHHNVRVPSSLHATRVLANEDIGVAVGGQAGSGAEDGVVEAGAHR